MKRTDDPIDIVLPWVDGSDPAWIESRRRRLAAFSGAGTDSAADCRYRDMGLLRHWFRGIERFAPWARRVFFVTCGHVPVWLDASNPRLRIVRHDEFLPARWLPTFNAPTIEMNFHRIPDLAERFVYFNDDTFLLRPVPAEFYFRGGDPVTPASLRPRRMLGFEWWKRYLANDEFVLNACIDTRPSIRANWRKWTSVRHLGLRRALGNALCWSVDGRIPVKAFGHMPSPQLKSTLDGIWRACPEFMEEMSALPFAADVKVNQWLATAWNLARGRFFPAKPGTRGTYFDVCARTIDEAREAVRSRAAAQICLNDSGGNERPELHFRLLRESFDEILPDRSSFEKPVVSGPGSAP
ncbi:MAG: Stealth CR1 domain-containing protein [Kiritimatiellae bacterium]|nr:Stealth CR1 domain-containing protein [Kiritimatiellia bacterium]